jgi:glycine dehydrogenase subunit 1
MPFIPHTESDIRAMLAAIGAPDIDALFEEIPAELRAPGLPGIPPSLSEMEVGRLMSGLAARDGRLLNFIGAGAYEHHVPAAVWAIVTRGEFYSAYTPYQAEASQGTLQLLYEYQSMMASLTGMDISNASLYDGASGLAEACLMAVRANRKSKSQRILVPTAVNPTYRDVARVIAGNQNLAFEPVPNDPKGGQTVVTALEPFAGQDITAVVVQQPNFFGTLEDVDAITDWAHANGALVVGVVNPTSLALLKPPGEWGARGADIACGDGQPLGVPLSSGGPYFGFMATKSGHVRQMPGRIIGRTVDVDGKPGFTLTLQAREQHIRPQQGDLEHLHQPGPARDRGDDLPVAARTGRACAGRGACMQRTQQLVDALTRVPGVRLAFDKPRFHEAVLLLDRPVAGVLAALAARGIVGGHDLSALYPVARARAARLRDRDPHHADIEQYAGALAEVMRGPAVAA